MDSKPSATLLDRRAPGNRNVKDVLRGRNADHERHERPEERSREPECRRRLHGGPLGGRRQAGELLDAGFPGVRNERGDSLLMLASYYGHVEATRLLLERGADPALPNGAGQTPLAGAAFKGNETIATVLLDAGADVDGAGPDGRTPLMFAAMFDKVEMMELLIQRGEPQAPRRGQAHRAGLRAVHGRGARGRPTGSEALSHLERQAQVAHLPRVDVDEEHEALEADVHRLDLVQGAWDGARAAGKSPTARASAMVAFPFGRSCTIAPTFQIGARARARLGELLRGLSRPRGRALTASAP